MATVDQLQTQLGVEGLSPRVIRSEDAATLRQVHVLGGAVHPGKARWVTLTISDSAATQAAAVTTALTP